MGSWKVTPADRDEEGKIKVDRTLADLLPPLPVAPDSGDEPADEPVLLSSRQFAGSAAAVLLLSLALFALSGQTAPATRVAVLPSAPVPTVARREPTAAPPTAAPTTAAMVVAYAAPGGDVLGPILLPTAAVARFGTDWAEVTWQGGRVWVRVSDAPSLEVAELPDLQPPAPLPVVIAPAPPAAPVAQQSAAPPAPDRTHERAMPFDRGPPTPVVPYTVR